MTGRHVVASPLAPFRAAQRIRLAALLAPLLLAACGGVVADEGDVGTETPGFDHAGGDVDVPPDVHDVPLDDGSTGDVETAAEDVVTDDAPDADAPPECSVPDDCDDGEPCDGVEGCVGGACRDGTALPDGSPCSTSGLEDGICRGSRCAPSSCGDGVTVAGEECDDGNLINGDGCETSCEFSCHTNTECDDAQDCTTDACAEVVLGRRCFNEPKDDGVACDDVDACTTGDRCTDGRCAGTALSCADADRCTVDTCDSSTPSGDPCLHTLLPDWYRDRDGDTYGSEAEKECSETAPGADWSDDAGDCCDANSNVHPNQLAFFVEPYICSGTGSFLFDYDCNGFVQLQYPHAATGCVGTDCDDCACTPGWCPLGWPDASMTCLGVPACGASGGWVTACVPFSGGTTDAGTLDGGTSDIYSDVLRDVTDSCVPVLETRRQACR